MEEIRVLRSVFMLLLVLGMHMGQSAAGAKSWRQCFDSCFKTCVLGSRGNPKVISNCGLVCRGHCNIEVNGERCILFWCWKPK